MTRSIKTLAAAAFLSGAVVVPAFAQSNAYQKPEILERSSQVIESGPSGVAATTADTGAYKPADRDAGNVTEATWAARHPDAGRATVRDPNGVVRMPGPQRADRNAVYYDSFSALFAGTPR
ncbi:MAG TPA: hypothetical protein VGD08_14405 [Stellaceae bacterium]